MKIEENTVVGLTYELKVTNETEGSELLEVEVRNEEDPFFFLFGNSGLPPKFEEQLLGKNQGDTFTFVLQVDEAYGESDDEMIVNVPKSQFSAENGFEPEMFEEGNFLPLMDEEGNSMQAKVLKNFGEELLLDFNHPLVGFNLHFEGSVHEVRKATDTEIAHGHVHGEHGEDH